MKDTKQKEIYKKITNGKIDVDEKAIAGQGELVAADGGSLVDIPIVDVIAPNFMNNSIYENCRIMNIDSARNTNGITIPQYDVSNVNDNTFWGVDAQWVGEGEDIDRSSIKFASKAMKLNKLSVNIPSTNELIVDVPALVSYVNYAGGEALHYKIDRAIIYGDAQYSMGGVVGSDNNATIYVPEGASKAETAQTMVSSYYGGQEGRWILSQDVWGTLVDEYADNFALQWDGPKAYLYGYPIQVLACANKNTMLLGDFSQYQIVQKELRRDISEHVLFDSDQNLIRLTARIQGTPLWNNTMHVANSATSLVSISNTLQATIDTSRVELLDTITTATSGFTAGGTATYTPISATTFNLDVSSGGYTLVDGGLGVLSAATLPVSGTIDYDTGVWTVDFTNQELLTDGTMISATDFDILTYTANGTLSLVTGASAYAGGSISMDISGGGYTLTEVSPRVLGTGLSGSANVTGTIESDGTWTVEFVGQELLTNGVAISASYDIEYATSQSSEIAPFVALSTMVSGGDRY